MQPSLSARNRLLAGIVTVLLFGIITPQAAAHGINLFAYVEGGQIRGQVFARGGAPIAAAQVTAFDPSGKEGATATTDVNGEFTMKPSQRCDWRLVATAGAGHEAEYTVSADEFSEDLPGEPSPGASPTGDNARQPREMTKAQNAPLAGQADTADGLAEIRGQLIALRRDLDRFRRDLRWQDLIGGVGYIFGIMGLAFYFLGVRRRERSAPPGGG